MIILDSGLLFILAYFLFWIFIAIAGVVLALKTLSRRWRDHHPHRG